MEEPRSFQKSKVLASEPSDHTRVIPGHRCGRAAEALPFLPISRNCRSDPIELVDKRSGLFFLPPADGVVCSALP